MGSVPACAGAPAPGIRQLCPVRKHLAGQAQVQGPHQAPALPGPPRVPCSAPAVYYEGLQDKLAQIRDARGALSALREEHREKLRRAAEEAERQRQIQLAQKLEIMRQKKQVRRPPPGARPRPSGPPRP